MKNKFTGSSFDNFMGKEHIHFCKCGKTVPEECHECFFEKLNKTAIQNHSNMKELTINCKTCQDKGCGLCMGV